MLSHVYCIIRVPNRYTDDVFLLWTNFTEGHNGQVVPEPEFQALKMRLSPDLSYSQVRVHACACVGVLVRELWLDDVVLYIHTLRCACMRVRVLRCWCVSPGVVG
jgi:hypothetical protein